METNNYEKQLREGVQAFREIAIEAYEQGLIDALQRELLCCEANELATRAISLYAQFIDIYTAIVTRAEKRS